ncbi:hypothetical protein V1477_014603 [Vespula maculifrons]|uniref:Uncharacterized protein n=1 Tax=Vespula maculifrons TaxID=7453 RepID=A0ABD2BHX2_VESMC
MVISTTRTITITTTTTITITTVAMAAAAAALAVSPAAAVTVITITITTIISTRISSSSNSSSSSSSSSSKKRMIGNSSSTRAPTAAPQAAEYSSRAAQDVVQSMTAAQKLSWTVTSLSRGTPQSGAVEKKSENLYPTNAKEGGLVRLFEALGKWSEAEFSTPPRSTRNEFEDREWSTGFPFVLALVEIQGEDDTNYRSGSSSSTTTTTTTKKQSFRIFVQSIDKRAMSLFICDKIFNGSKARKNLFIVRQQYREDDCIYLIISN